MLYVIFLGVVGAFFLIALLRGGTPRVPFRQGSASPTHRLGERPRTLQEPTPADPLAAHLKNLSLQVLEDFCRRFLEKHHVEPRSIDYSRQQDFHIAAVFEHPLMRGNVILHGVLAGESGVIDSDVVIGFSDMVKAERAMKGVLITNGYFSEEVMKLNEGANIELIDANQLIRFMKQITPDLVPASVSLR